MWPKKQQFCPGPAEWYQGGSDGDPAAVGPGLVQYPAFKSILLKTGKLLIWAGRQSHRYLHCMVLEDAMNVPQRIMNIVQIKVCSCLALCI